MKTEKEVQQFLQQFLPDANYGDAWSFLYDHPDQIFEVIQDLLKDEVLSNDGWQKVVDEINLALNALKKRDQSRE